MAVHFFYEEIRSESVSEAVGTECRHVHRYYYDDISDEVMIRSFQSLDGKALRFEGEERVEFSLALEYIRQQACARRISPSG